MGADTWQGHAGNDLIQQVLIYKGGTLIVKTPNHRTGLVIIPTCFGEPLLGQYNQTIVIDRMTSLKWANHSYIVATEICYIHVSSLHIFPV